MEREKEMLCVFAAVAAPPVDSVRRRSSSPRHRDDHVGEDADEGDAEPAMCSGHGHRLLMAPLLDLRLSFFFFSCTGDFVNHI